MPPGELPAQLASFLEEVKARPEEDAPRLVLADWLQEQSDSSLAARGEFVHLQVVRARLAEDDPQAESVRRRERELLRDHALDWLGPLADLTQSWRFERGFVYLEVRGEKLPVEESWGSLEPDRCVWVEGLKIVRLEFEHEEALKRLPLLPYLSLLDLSQNVIPPEFFSPWPTLPNLREFRLASCLLNDEDLADLLSSGLPHLRTLDLSGNHLTDAGAEVLVQANFLGSLTTLFIGGNQFSPEGLELLRSRFGNGVVSRVGEM